MIPRAGLGTVPTLYRGGSVGDWVDICLSIPLVDGTISPRVDVLKVCARSVCRGGLDCRLGSRARGGAHGEHVAHVRDAGGVEAQRLVER